MQVNISEAKAHFSQLVERALHGETVVISKNNHPLVDMVPHRHGMTRRLGLLAGRLVVPDEVFAQEDEEINRMFYGDPA